LGNQSEEDTFLYNPALASTWSSVFEPEDFSGEEKKKVPNPLASPRAVPLAEKCYLCMNNIIENARDIVIMRCSQRCGTRLHFSCVVNSMWPHQKTGITCPVCTKDEHLTKEYGSPPTSLGGRESSVPPSEERDTFGPSDEGESHLKEFKQHKGGEYHFLCKIRTILAEDMGWAELRVVSEAQLKDVMRGIQACVNERAYTISGEGAGMKTTTTTPAVTYGEAEFHAALYLIQEVRISTLLSLGLSIACVHEYITDRFEGLLLMGLSMMDIKTIEQNNDMEDFVRLYDICSPKLRSYFGEDHMCLKNLIRAKLSAKSMETLGITVHEMCIMRLTQEEMQQFDYLTMEDWIFRLKMTATCLQVLRIKVKDIAHPDGKLHKLGWDMIAFDRYMNLSTYQKNVLKLHVKVPKSGGGSGSRTLGKSFASAASETIASPSIASKTHYTSPPKVSETPSSKGRKKPTTWNTRGRWRSTVSRPSPSLYYGTYSSSSSTTKGSRGYKYREKYRGVRGRGEWSKKKNCTGHEN